MSSFHTNMFFKACIMIIRCSLLLFRIDPTSFLKFFFSFQKIMQLLLIIKIDIVMFQVTIIDEKPWCPSPAYFSSSSSSFHYQQDSIYVCLLVLVNILALQSTLTALSSSLTENVGVTRDTSIVHRLTRREKRASRRDFVTSPRQQVNASGSHRSIPG